ncbi:hypothetical protein PoB_002383400 [Plakobranchus ocellatus]|uniref:Uncharacterized protein n=1 Tax=Plakobranchus ocellatus TaxID=259542 RepID=A0AAV3ZTW7_9GAST|nr:hypothetical protein PoB_002383400 [Plakobranchus ocellatus]
MINFCYHSPHNSVKFQDKHSHGRGQPHVVTRERLLWQHNLASLSTLTVIFFSSSSAKSVAWMGGVAWEDTEKEARSTTLRAVASDPPNVKKRAQSLPVVAVFPKHSSTQIQTDGCADGPTAEQFNTIAAFARIRAVTSNLNGTAGKFSWRKSERPGFKMIKRQPKQRQKRRQTNQVVRWKRRKRGGIEFIVCNSTNLKSILPDVQTGRR